MIKLKNILSESLDSPYKWSDRFKFEYEQVEDEEGGGVYRKEVFSFTQIIRFKTEEGIEYMWYAQRSYHNENFWTVAFGVYKSTDDRGVHKLDIGLVGGIKNPMRVFSTVLAITNRFIELDEDNSIHYLQLESEGDKRSELYIKRIIPKIENFKIDHIDRQYSGIGDVYKSIITLVRYQ